MTTATTPRTETDSPTTSSEPEGALTVGDVLVFDREERMVTDVDRGCYWFGDNYVPRSDVHALLDAGRVGLERRGSP